MVASSVPRRPTARKRPVVLCVKSSENNEFTAYLGEFRDLALVSRLFPFLTSAADHLDASSARLPARDRRPPSGNSGIRPTLGWIFRMHRQKSRPDTKKSWTRQFHTPRGPPKHPHFHPRMGKKNPRDPRQTFFRAKLPPIWSKKSKKFGQPARTELVTLASSSEMLGRAPRSRPKLAEFLSNSVFGDEKFAFLVGLEYQFLTSQVDIWGRRGVSHGPPWASRGGEHACLGADYRGARVGGDNRGYLWTCFGGYRRGSSGASWRIIVWVGRFSFRLFDTLVLICDAEHGCTQRRCWGGQLGVVLACTRCRHAPDMRYGVRPRETVTIDIFCSI